MPAETVNRDLQLSQVLSVRLTERQLQRLQKTLRNFGIQGGSMSDQLREFFRLLYWRSARYARERERIQKERERIQKERERERDRYLRGEGETDVEEDLEYLRWLNSLGEEQSL
jgi:Succinate dehydrogenase/fumarate reductase, flavoprotein subunit